MKPAPFDYESPDSLERVLGLLGDGEREVKLIAGGQSLVPLLNMRLARPDLLVDVRRVRGLPGVEICDDGSLVIGAQVTQAAALGHPTLRSRWPLLAEGMAAIAHPQIRNRGTVCGSLAHHDPAAELPALAVALDATFSVHGPGGRREVAARDMFVTVFTTAVGQAEMLTFVRFPPAPPGTGWAFEEVARRRGDFATIGVAVGLRRDDDGQVSWARIVFCGAGSVPVRAEGAERLLAGERPDTGLFAAAADVAAGEIDPPDDVHASAGFRREAARYLVARSLERAWRRCS